MKHVINTYDDKVKALHVVTNADYGSIMIITEPQNKVSPKVFVESREHRLVVAMAHLNSVLNKAEQLARIMKLHSDLIMAKPQVDIFS